jgi:hypothetical protein
MILEHIKAEADKLQSTELYERVDRLCAALEEANAAGKAPSPWLISLAQESYEELGRRQIVRARLIAALDSLIDRHSGKG